MTKNEQQLWSMTLTRLREQCNKDDIPFSLTISDITPINLTKCKLTGIMMVRGKNSLTRPVLDMIDQSGGYVSGNVIVVSYIAQQCLRIFDAYQLYGLAEKKAEQKCE